MSETMTYRTTGRARASRQVRVAALPALVLYAVAVGIVRLLDRSAQVAQPEQLGREGQLVPVACTGCAGLGAQVLSWMSDGRALLVFAVLLAVAASGVLVGRRTPGPRRPSTTRT